MTSSRQRSGNTYLHIGRRIVQRLMVALFLRRAVVIGVILALLVLGLLWATAGLRGQAAATGMSPVAVTVQALEPRGDIVLLVLQERDGIRQLRVNLALTEARVLALHQGVQLPGDSPEVYELFQHAIQELGGRVDHVVVSDVEDDVHRARVVLAVGGDLLEMRTNAATAATLAVKSGAPIFVEGSLFSASRNAFD